MKTYEIRQLDYSGDVFFHIGPHKTGTTTIQRFLKDNAARLVKQGVLYPEGGRREALVNRSDEGLRNLLHYHHPLARDLLSKEVEKVNSHIQNIQREIHEHRPRVVILSSEFLGRPSVTGSFVYEDLRRIFKNADRSWILYLRRQDGLLVSHFAEGLKYGKFPWPKAIIETEDAGHLDHENRIRKIVASIGSDRLIVRSFEKEKKNLIPSFLNVVSVSDKMGFVYPEKANVSVSARAIHLQRIANCSPIASRRLRHLALRLDSLLSAIGLEGGDAHSLLSESDRRSLLQKYHNGNLKIEKRFFNEGESGLFIED